MAIESGGMEELANASVIHPRDPGSNLSRDIIFSYSVCIAIEFKFASC
jgi:hypothetical protein